MISTTYYRTLLSPDEQKSYGAIVRGLLAWNTEISIKQCASQKESIQRIVRAVHLDHPELFYVDFWHYHYRNIVMLQGSVLSFQFMLDKDPALAIMNSLNAKANKMKGILVNITSEEMAYFRVAKEIATNTKYNDSDSAFWEHTIAGTLHHKAVCEGISKLFLFLCQRLDLPCAMVTGTLNREPHAWNMLELNGRRRYIDVTGLLHSISLYALAPRSIFKTESQFLGMGYCWQIPRERSDSL